jgi:signal transduction histidine kinase
LFGFLASTRLPVVSSLVTLVGWSSLGLAVLATTHAIFCWLAWDSAFWSAQAPWSGALPALVAAPCWCAAFWSWRKHRMQQAVTLLFLGLFTFAVLANWPHGAFSPAWYLHPVLALLATVSLGVIPGLLLTMGAVVVLLLAAMQPHDSISWPMQPDLWLHVASLASITLASALTGAIVNRLVFMTLLTAEAQRRKNFESSRALRHREKLLRHALRVETIGDLAGMVCHQLRNTFQVLHGHVTLGELADDEERRRRLQLIEATLDETQPLLDQLMVMAHPEEGTVSVCELGSMLRHFHEQARLVLPRSIELECHAPEESLMVLLNPRGLIHVLWNLVINARQAIVGDGRIVLRCGGERQQVWLEVSDSGCGIPKELQERIFDPYFTTKPAGQGTGLGLTAVARFVRSSLGIVQVDSDPGRGTTFRLRFPRALDAPQSIRA